MSDHLSWTICVSKLVVVYYNIFFLLVSFIFIQFIHKDRLHYTLLCLENILKRNHFHKSVLWIHKLHSLVLHTDRASCKDKQFYMHQYYTSFYTLPVPHLHHNQFQLWTFCMQMKHIFHSLDCSSWSHDPLSKPCILRLWCKHLDKIHRYQNQNLMKEEINK